jgi:hypothetical protein
VLHGHAGDAGEDVAARLEGVGLRAVLGAVAVGVVSQALDAWRAGFRRQAPERVVGVGGGARRRSAVCGLNIATESCRS